MIYLSLFFVLVLSLLAFFNWRLGLTLSVITALAQDPLRKLTPDEPAYFNLFVGVVFAAAVAGCLIKSKTLDIDRFAEKGSNLRLALSLTLTVILLQSLHSLLRFGVPQVTLIGLLNYLVPFIAIIYIAKLRETMDLSEIRKFFRVYLYLAIPAVFTVYLEQAGLESPLFGEVGVGIWITDLGTILQAYSGIYRAAEIAAWHIFTCASLLILMSTYDKPTLLKSIGIFLLVAVLIYIGVFTGRRKFIVMVAIFVVSYGALLLWSSQKHRHVAIGLGMMATLAFLLFGGERFDPNTGYVEVIGERSAVELYLSRSSGVFGDIQERFTGLGIAPVSWAYTRTGFFGAGVGVGTQGVQHLGNFSSLVGGAAEGGLGRLMVELGAPGLVLIAILVGLIVHRLFTTAESKRITSRRDKRFFCGLIAVAIANVASYTIAQGMFGDIFVLLFNGVVFGALLTFARETQVARRTSRAPRNTVSGTAMPVPTR